MGPLTLAVDGKSSAVAYTDAGPKKAQNLSFETKKPFAAVSTEAEKPVDFFRTLFEGMIAGGTAGVIVETALYPIDTIKTRLQAAHGGGKIVLKGLYSGLAGNLAGVLPASAVFVGVYEPTKQKLLRMFPENLTAVAHLIVRMPPRRAKRRNPLPEDDANDALPPPPPKNVPNPLMAMFEAFRGMPGFSDITPEARRAATFRPASG